VRATGSAQFQTLRARIILMASRGSLNEEIAATLEIPEQTIVLPKNWTGGLGSE